MSDAWQEGNEPLKSTKAKWENIYIICNVLCIMWPYTTNITYFHTKSRRQAIIVFSTIRIESFLTD